MTIESSLKYPDRLFGADKLAPDCLPLHDIMIPQPKHKNMVNSGTWTDTRISHRQMCYSTYLIPVPWAYYYCLTRIVKNWPYLQRSTWRPQKQWYPSANANRKWDPPHNSKEHEVPGEVSEVSVAYSLRYQSLRSFSGVKTHPLFVAINITYDVSI